MKKVLILTYYYPPYTGIEGNRPASWVKDFPKYGLNPIVVTRQWAAGQQKTWDDYIQEYGSGVEKKETGDATIFRLPHRYRPLFKKHRSNLLSPVVYWGYKLFGGFHIDTDAYYSFKAFLEDLLSKEKVDLLLVTSPPLNVVELGVHLSEKFSIPLVVDFRDSYNNLLLNRNQVFSFKEKVENYLLKRHVQNWLKSISLITAVSKPVLHLVDPENQVPHQLIYNAFEESLFTPETQAAPRETLKFTITILGNLYPKQDIDFMVQGFSQFLSRVPAGEVLIQFIGLAMQTEVVAKIEAGLPAGSYLITERMLREEALKYTADTNVFYYLGWRGYQGIYSGKIFEYLGARKNILIAPNDFDVLDEFITETSAGKLGQTPEEMTDALLTWYQEWKANGYLQYMGKEEVISSYTRENQTRILAERLNEILVNTSVVKA